MDKSLNRLEFLRTLGRGGMLAGLTGLGVAALHGSKEVSECFNENQCAACNVHGSCQLPEKKEVTHERQKDV